MEGVGSIDTSCDNQISEKKRCHSNQANTTTSKKRRKLDPIRESKIHQDPSNYLAETYFNSAEKSLSSEGFNKFITILVNYESQPKSERDEAALYRDVVDVLLSENKTVLADEFISFIRPQTAKKLGKLDNSNFMTKAWSLFNTIDSNHFSKMLNALESLSNVSPSEVKLAEIENALKPLFKGHQCNFVNSIAQLFGTSKPPAKDLSEFEEVTDITDNIEFEQVKLPRGDVSERSCPGDASCSCICHDMASDQLLCTACNIRYINGRIYVQRQKQMRSALVDFSYGVTKQEVQSKLYPQYYAQQQAAASNHIPSPLKSEKKDRKNSQGESSKVSENKNEDQPASENSKSPLRSSNHETATFIRRATDKRLWGGSDASLNNVGSVFFEENKEGCLEFYKQASDDSHENQNESQFHKLDFEKLDDNLEEQIEGNLNEHFDENLEEAIHENLDEQLDEHQDEIFEELMDEHLEDQIEEHLPLIQEDDESQEDEEEIMEDVEDIISDNEFDLHPSSSDELSSPTRYNPGKNMGSPKCFKNPSKSTKRSKKAMSSF